MRFLWVFLVAGLVCVGGCASKEVAMEESITLAEPSPFPPEGVDHLEMISKVTVELFGIGSDTMELRGSVAVHRSDGIGPDGTKMKGALLAASLLGKSKVFGNVVGIESPTRTSPCEYWYEGPQRYPGYFDILGWFFIPKHNIIVFNKRPVRVKGVAPAMPAVGEVADSGPVEIELYDLYKPAGPAVGKLTSATGETPDEVRILEWEPKECTVEELRAE